MDYSIFRQNNTGQDCHLVCTFYTVHQRAACNGNLAGCITHTGMGMDPPDWHIKFCNDTVTRLPVALNTAVAI